MPPAKSPDFAMWLGPRLARSADRVEDKLIERVNAA